MFVLKEAGYQLFRNRGRSILLICVAAMLCGCVAFYMGNISANRQALRDLSDTTPTVVRITNKRGDTGNLLIKPDQYDEMLSGMPLRNVHATVQVHGAWSQEERAAAKELFTGGDVNLLGLNDFTAGEFGEEDIFNFAGGYDASMFQGSDAVCVISEDFAQSSGLKPGDEMSLPLYQVLYNSVGMPVYQEIGECSLKVCGTFNLVKETYFMADAYFPAQWLRSEMEAMEMQFYYNNFNAELADSLKLNQYKEQFMFAGYVTGIPSPDLADPADTHFLSTEDELFIRTAERLGNSLLLFTNFQYPFLGVMVLLVTLVIFLVLRGSRRDMAISLSLGRPRLLIAGANLIALMGAELTGCLIALPFVILLAGVGILGSLGIIGAFLACALLGNIIGLLFLLRFDPIALLINTD